jgi:hypothetical protein
VVSRFAMCFLRLVQRAANTPAQLARGFLRSHAMYGSAFTKEDNLKSHVDCDQREGTPRKPSNYVGIGNAIVVACCEEIGLLHVKQL